MVVGGIVKRAVTWGCKKAGMNEDDAKFFGRAAQVCTWVVALDVTDIGEELLGTVVDNSLDNEL